VQLQHEIPSALVMGAAGQILLPRFLPRSSIKISETRVPGIPRSSSNSQPVNCQFLLITARMCSTFLGFLLVEGLPKRGSLSTDFRPSLKHQ
jgi:hypothetical protein